MKRALSIAYLFQARMRTIVSFLKVRSFLKTVLNLKNTCKIESLLIKEIVSICGGNPSGVDRLWAPS